MATDIVILTGAGISAESGIRTFRDADGLWENHAIEDVASPEGFMRDPGLVQKFYNQRRRQLLGGDVAPNEAHRALARLQVSWPGRVTLVTQNIDDLHERAGSKDVVHMHGELLKARCVTSGHVIEQRTDIDNATHCDCCPNGNVLRPHIVWFGEMPFGMDLIQQSLINANLFISIGTSGHVYPAAGFAHIAQQVSARTVELNLEPSEVAGDFTESRYGPASKIVPEFIEEMLTSLGG